MKVTRLFARVVLATLLFNVHIQNLSCQHLLSADNLQMRDDLLSISADQQHDVAALRSSTAKTCALLRQSMAETRAQAPLNESRTSAIGPLGHRWQFWLRQLCQQPEMKPARVMAQEEDGKGTGGVMTFPNDVKMQKPDEADLATRENRNIAKTSAPRKDANFPLMRAMQKQLLTNERRTLDHGAFSEKTSPTTFHNDDRELKLHRDVTRLKAKAGQSASSKDATNQEVYLTTDTEFGERYTDQVEMRLKRAVNGFGNSGKSFPSRTKMAAPKMAIRRKRRSTGENSASGSDQTSRHLATRQVDKLHSCIEAKCSGWSVGNYMDCIYRHCIISELQLGTKRFAHKRHLDWREEESIPGADDGVVAPSLSQRNLSGGKLMSSSDVHRTNRPLTTSLLKSAIDPRSVELIPSPDSLVDFRAGFEDVVPLITSRHPSSKWPRPSARKPPVGEKEAEREEEEATYDDNFGGEGKGAMFGAGRKRGYNDITDECVRSHCRGSVQFSLDYFQCRDSHCGSQKHRRR